MSEIIEPSAEDLLRDEADISDENTALENNEASGAEDSEEKIRQELGEVKDKYIRLFAEFDNYKRRNAKERLELINRAGQEVIRELLPVMDDFERFFKAFPLESENKDGIQLIYHKLRRTLEQKGLQQMKSIGEEFDADKHEAITEIPAPNPDQKGKVIDEVEKGYLLGDKILRYAKVIVGK